MQNFRAFPTRPPPGAANAFASSMQSAHPNSILMRVTRLLSGGGPKGARQREIEAAREVKGAVAASRKGGGGGGGGTDGRSLENLSTLMRHSAEDEDDEEYDEHDDESYGRRRGAAQRRSMPGGARSSLSDPFGLNRLRRAFSFGTTQGRRY